MSFQLTRRVIKLLCGAGAYDRGEAYHQAGQVNITYQDPDHSCYEARVTGSGEHKVTVEIDHNGDVHADCTCSAARSSGRYCEHIAAVLLNIHDVLQGGGSGPIRSYAPSLLGANDHRLGQLEPRYALSSAEATGVSTKDVQLTTTLLGLFDEKPLRTSGRLALFDTRSPLEIQFICKPFAYGYRKYMFGIEMKLGPKRLYVVQKIRELLEQIDRGEAYRFTKHFTYDAKLHSFGQADEAVLRQLIRTAQHESMYRETSGTYSTRSGNMSGDRMLLIPPSSWEALLPLLVEATTVELYHDENGPYSGIHVSDELIPLQFQFDQSQTQADGYQLDVTGMDRITIMEAYGLVLTEGKLLRMQPGQGRQLAELKRMLEAHRKDHIEISSDQIEPFMEKVVPGLMKLGSVRITRAVSERVVQSPLQAKLYLDRIKDRLLAGLEFQYGDIIINPLDAEGQKRGSDRILVRDGDQERRILDLMEHSSFAKTDAGYFMDDEDAEYDFLYHVVPQLEQLLQVYATSAVKTRIHKVHAPPKVKIDMDERTDWLEFKFEMDGIPESDIQHLLLSIEEKRKYYRMPSGALLPLDGSELHEVIRFMNEMGIHKGDIQGSSIRLPAVRGLQLMDSQEAGKSVTLGKSLRQLLEHMRNPDHLDFPVPVGLTSILRDYQQYGYQWLKTLAHYRFGGVLADDMGLGKTLQSIAFIVSVLQDIRDKGQPVLIVAPASLVYNWRNELAKFAPEITAVIADGSRSERSDVMKNTSVADVVITSYPLLRRDIDLYIGHSFHTLVLDEAQVFKNHATQTAQAVKMIQARHRFALTGTPVENALEELWSIFDAVFPELFPGGRKAFNQLSRETVAKRIRPFLLRRLKTDVLQELPEKIESVQASELLPEQKKLYLAYLAKLQQETLKHLNEEGFQKNRIKILAGLTRLRQLCCHPALFVEGYQGSSSKFKQLLEIMEECRSSGKRVLIFSQFTSMLGLIGRELGYQGVPYFYLDGQTPASERVALCTRFNEGEHDVFLISLKAGGTGLNLIGADTVILYDLWWNPAVEQQAADRAHRIGQKNVVQVIRLVTQGTVEDKMYELQQRKKDLIDQVIQPGQEVLSSLSEEEIRGILMI